MTPLEKSAKESLRFLFSKYLKGPTALYEFNSIAKRFRVNPVELSDYMLDKGWIRERWVYSGDVVAGKITIKGIEEIDPIYVRDKLSQIIGGLGEAGGAKPLIEILENKVSEYSIAMDMVRQLEHLKLIEVRHPKDTIVIQLTEDGRHYYERGSKSFYTLMAY
jgi:hypothetical protein